MVRAMIVDKIPTTIIEPRITQMISISEACKKNTPSISKHIQYAHSLLVAMCRYERRSVKRKPSSESLRLII